ncbi:helix-turn-helix domain-containing protein [Nocardia niigatensis]
MKEVAVTLLRAVRKQHGMTLEALAERTGLTKSYLSKVERQLSMPSIAVAMKIAQALDVDVGRLFSEEASETKIVVDRAADAVDGERYRSIAASMLGRSMSPFLVRPTATFTEEPHRDHTGQEFLFVHTGTVELEYDGRTTTLHEGDCAYLDATIAHRIRSVGATPAQVVVVAGNER